MAEITAGSLVHKSSDALTATMVFPDTWSHRKMCSMDPIEVRKFD
jgi:hypothetical protein